MTQQISIKYIKSLTVSAGDIQSTIQDYVLKNGIPLNTSSYQDLIWEIDEDLVNNNDAYAELIGTTVGSENVPPAQTSTIQKQLVDKTETIITEEYAKFVEEVTKRMALAFTEQNGALAAIATQ